MERIVPGGAVQGSRPEGAFQGRHPREHNQRGARRGGRRRGERRASAPTSHPPRQGEGLQTYSLTNLITYVKKHDIHVIKIYSSK